MARLWIVVITAIALIPIAEIRPIVVCSGLCWPINAAMFLVEIGAGLAAGSASLQADALDFFGDAANYAISLLVVGMALRYRAMAALAKGTTMGLFGLWIIGAAIWHALHGTLPSAITMGAVGFAALAANAISFGLLWGWRRKHALGVDLHTQRRPWKSCRVGCCGWCLRYGHGLAGCYRCGHHGWLSFARGVVGYPAAAE